MNTGDMVPGDFEYVDEILQNEQNNRFNDWRRRVNKKLPELASRVFALRGRGYPGCAGQWNMEKRLGNVITEINNYDTDRYFTTGKNNTVSQLNLEVCVGMLYQEVKEAEESLKDSPR